MINYWIINWKTHKKLCTYHRPRGLYVLWYNMYWKATEHCARKPPVYDGDGQDMDGRDMDGREEDEQCVWVKEGREWDVQEEDGVWDCDKQDNFWWYQYPNSVRHIISVFRFLTYHLSNAPCHILISHSLYLYQTLPECLYQTSQYHCTFQIISLQRYWGTHQVCTQHHDIQKTFKNLSFYIALSHCIASHCLLQCYFNDYNTYSYKLYQFSLWHYQYYFNGWVKFNIISNILYLITYCTLTKLVIHYISFGTLIDLVSVYV